MKQRLQTLRWLLAAALWCLVLPAWAEVAVPALTQRVTDLTHTLSPAQQQAMERELAEFEQRKGVQIAVLLVPTTAPESIEQYSIRVVDQWRLGRKNVDDGLLLLVAKNDRTLRIEVGYGLEGVVPDAVANRVIEEIIVPYFRTGDFAAGIQAGLNRLMRVVDGEPLPPPQQRQVERPTENLLPFLLFAFFIISGLFSRMLGRLFGATATGGIMGGLFWLLMGSVSAAILIAVLAFVMALLTGGGGPGFYPGGFYGGRGGRGGFGGGGFGGGGGGFGGGGASGRW